MIAWKNDLGFNYCDTTVKLSKFHIKASKLFQLITLFKEPREQQLVVMVISKVITLEQFHSGITQVQQVIIIDF